MKPKTYTIERISNGWIVRIWSDKETISLYKKTLKSACEYIRKYEGTWG